MKVLIVNTVSFKLNGITSVIMNYYRNMNKSQIMMDIVAINNPPNEYVEELKREDSMVYILKRREGVIKYFIQLIKLLRTNQYDIIHIHGNSALMIVELLAAYVSGVKVRIVHSHNTSCSHMKLHKLLHRTFDKLTTERLACGQLAGEWLYKKQPFTILHNGIDMCTFLFDEDIRKKIRTKLGIEDELLLGHIGNFVEQKNHSFIIEVFEKLCQQKQNSKLLLIGEGAELQRIKLAVEERELQDKVLFIPRTMEIAQYMMAMDIFLLPSLHEGLPVVLIEAQASGLPCIVADTVAKEANITGELKYLPIKDSEVWVQGIFSEMTKLKQNDREEKCVCGQKKIREAGYDITQNANQLRNIYEKALKRFV